ncbi:hypothetical protein ITJ43_13455 [Microbacterium sp. VKM Ac-2870]|uniref:hypothetical protein n=1 Tax=Microbacterium sp. VKM Ac-2870 TaxID=2783825 RepID=UPI001889FB40|nr:hypothetical protein [Microbacterium sp. VKM Ac-2870]MBF4563139.1 hypothetical protein [Microbacterium sp. VKM Ac-2870]
MRRTLPVLLSIAAIAAALTLTACAAGSNVAPSPTSTSASAAAAATPTAVAGAPAIAAPMACDAVDLKPDVKVTGTDLAACVVAYSTVAGSGHETFTSSDGSTGTADVVFGDAPAMSGTIAGPDGTTSFVLTPDAAWVTIDGVWVEGDGNSTETKKMLAGTIGQAYRAAADPTVAASFISSAPSWTVQKDQDLVTLPDNSQVSAWRLQADAPFTMLGADVQEMVVWLSSAHVPVGNQATVSVGGIQTTTSQHYSGWGMPVSIATPQP